MIDEVEQCGKCFFMPKLELFVATGVNEALIFVVRDAETVEVDGIDVDEVSLDEFRINVGWSAGGEGLFGKLSKQNAAGRNESHTFVELAYRTDDVLLRKVLFRFGAEQEGIAS